MIVAIPECCAMPCSNREGEHYQCATCGTMYRVTNGVWGRQQLTSQQISYAGPTGRELPGEHWNARVIREQVQNP